MWPAWRVIGASVQGTSHARTGLACQDAHAYRRLPGDVLLLAVADGAGSAERSDQGAQAAVEAALTALAEALTGPLAGGWPSLAAWEALLAEAFDRARAAVEQLAEAEALPARSFATTLLCAVASGSGLAVAQLGDGAAVAVFPEGELALAAAPQRGEYANETYFLTQASPAPPLDVRVYPEPVSAIAIMTDGLLRLVLDLTRGQPHRPFFDPLLAFAAGVADEAAGCAQLAEFLRSEKVCARTDDDKTLLLAVRQLETA